MIDTLLTRWANKRHFPWKGEGVTHRCHTATAWEQEGEKTEWVQLVCHRGAVTVWLAWLTNILPETSPSPNHSRLNSRDASGLKHPADSLLAALRNGITSSLLPQWPLTVSHKNAPWHWKRGVFWNCKTKPVITVVNWSMTLLLEAILCVILWSF